MDIYRNRIQFWSGFFMLGFSLFLGTFFFLKFYFVIWHLFSVQGKRFSPLVDLIFWVVLPILLALFSFAVATRVEKQVLQERRIQKLYFYRLSWLNFLSMISLNWLGVPEIEIWLALATTMSFIMVYRLYRNSEKGPGENEHDTV